MGEPVTDPAAAEQEQGQVQPVPDTADSDEQAQAEQQREDEQRGEDQIRAEHDFQEQNVVVERSGPDEVHPAGQPGFGGELPYAGTRDTATASEREGNEGVVGATESVMAAQPIGATANESPVMPASAQAGAAKAHAMLGHLARVAQAAQAEIERYVPPDLLAAAERDAMLFIRSAL
jgi:hypothetical protein